MSEYLGVSRSAQRISRFSGAASSNAPCNRLNDYIRSIPDDIAYCENDPPIADLVPQPTEGKRKLGFLKGQVEVPDEALFGADAKIEDMFYGKDGCES